MRQALWIFTLASAVVALSVGALGAALDSRDAIHRAKEQIATNNPKAAADLLENVLGESRGEDRDQILDLLKQSYKSLIRNARAGGRTREAALYSDDLAILEAQPGVGVAFAPPVALPPVPAATPAAPVSSTSPTFVSPPVPEPAPPPTVPDLPAIPAPGPDPRGGTPVALPRSDKALERAGFEDPAPRSSADSPPALEKPDAVAAAPPTPSAETSVRSGRTTTPAAMAELPPTSATPRAAPVDSAPKTTNRVGNKIQTEAATSPPDVPAARELGAADALFTEKKYEEAGKIYADLAAKGRLPSARKKVWAYCRWAAVVARVNAHPRDDKEWDDIEKELQSIQLLTPGNWYGEYIKDRVAATRRGERPSKRSGGLVVRGAAPEEPAAPLDLPSASDPPAAPGAAAPAPKGEPPAAISTATAPNWRIHETASFRIFHVDPTLAEQAAEAAEAVRARQGTRWGSKLVQAPWSPRCDIYLYPTAADFARMTGQPETSPGFSTMGVGGGRIVTRRVNLRADHPQMLSAILPHEVTHVVLADVFPEQQIPRWADEGMAVLAEPAAEQAGRAADLNAPLAERRLFKLGQLMAIDYPESKDWNLFYAQSVSLTQFLVRQGTAAQFVAFLKNAQGNGPDTAVREIYKIDGLDDLESRWREFATRQASQVASAEASADLPSAVQR